MALKMDVVVDEASHSSIGRLCEDFLRKSNATCALLIGQDGMLLHRCGAAADLDLDSLSALAAGAFASGREMARLIGETTFDVAIQQGQRNHLQVIRVGEDALLVAVFDDHTTAAMVRLHGLRAARRLAHVFSHGAAAAVRALIGDPEDELTTDLPSEFVDQTQARGERVHAALRMRTVALALALAAGAVAILGQFLRP